MIDNVQLQKASMPASSSNDIPTIGGIRYEGALVADGIIDLHSAAEALNGFETAFHYFLAKEDPALASFEVPIPIEIKKGSWEALIPTTFLGWIGTAAGVATTAYITAAAKKLAENGFKDETLSSLAAKALRSIQQVITIAKHIGHLDLAKVTNVRWSDTDVMLTNNAGETLNVPVSEWKKLAEAPRTLLKRMAAVVETERTLVVSVAFGSMRSEALITNRDKRIFIPDEEVDPELLFPELTHGLPVTLEGVVTRENGRTSTLGFLYRDHVLTCMPASGDMLPYKKHLFLRCQMTGVISRTTELGDTSAKKPKIIFSKLTIISDHEQLGLGLAVDDDD